MYRSPFTADSRQTTAFRAPGNWSCGFHTGVDRVCPKTTLVAPMAGIVTRVNDCGADYGNHIVVSSTAENRCMLMAHFAQLPKVKKGQAVIIGQQVGVEGSTGHSSGMHLHIEFHGSSVWRYGKDLINPNDCINWSDFGTNTNTGKDDFMAKAWKNGRTKENVYQNTYDCKRKRNPIGTLKAGEKATCTAIADGCYLVLYDVVGGVKAGFVAYPGGVK